ncbi:MAG TPA: peptidylprolyl isomerase [Bacteroidota bacterium]|nr:peptidylprolyl isomerase [Bacteroidota bacterium]
MKKLHIFVEFFILLLGSYRMIGAQTIDSITELQNARNVADGKLYAYLHSSNPIERSRAALALANIQDSSSIPVLLPMLDDSIPMVRRSVAFALGQTGRQEAAKYLIRRIPLDADAMSAQEEIDALAKCGNGEDLKTLIAIAPRLPGRIQRSVALSIARFAIRRIKDSLATEYAASLIGNSESRPMAVYALMRIADSTSVARHLARFIPLMDDSSAETRMWTGSLLSLASDSLARAAVVSHAVDDPDWRVRVNCVRALKSQGERASRLLLSLVSDNNEHVALTAFSLLSSLPEKYLPNNLADDLRTIVTDSTKFTWRERGEAALLFAAVLKERSVSLLCNYLKTEPLFRAKIISALGETRSAKAIPALQNELRQSDSRVVSAAVQSYENVIVNKDSAVQAEFTEKILPLLARRDLSVSFSVASAFEDTAVRREIRTQGLTKFVTVYQRLSTPEDVEVMVEFMNVFAGLKAEAAIPLLQRSLQDNDKVVRDAAARALHEITGTDYAPSAAISPESKKFYKEEDLGLLERYRSASILTSKGLITIDFRPDEAPYTVLNFIVLAKKHFFDGLIFHRVVPNFVIQGGDPQGTGFGGPGYAIRTEVHPDALYSEGAVGMASAGKDTEGSQFFITHCPTPHLDGRYSIFAYTKDLDVVGKIQVGDTILSVTLSE